MLLLLPAIAFGLVVCFTAFPTFSFSRFDAQAVEGTTATEEAGRSDIQDDEPKIAPGQIAQLPSYFSEYDEMEMYADPTKYNEIMEEEIEYAQQHRHLKTKKKW